MCVVVVRQHGHSWAKGPRLGNGWSDTAQNTISSAEILRISARKVDRVKKRFVEEGMEAAVGGRQGRRSSYVRKADGEFEARLVALSCAEPPEGHSQWSLRLLADRVVELGHIDSVSHETVRRVLKKTQSNRGGGSAG